jgi:hypothetical protein
MFEDSLLDANGKGRTKKPATVAISFLLQSIAIGILILLPLVYTEALPQHVLTRLLMTPPAPPSLPPAIASTPVRVQVAAIRPQSRFEQPRVIPRGVARLREDPIPPSVSIGAVADQIMIIGRSPDTFLDGPIAEIPAPPPSEPERTLVGGDVMAARLVYRPSPVYPEIAKRARGARHSPAASGDQ